MVNLAATMEDMKVALIDVIRGSLDTGFQLVAGSAGARIANTVQTVMANNRVVIQPSTFADVAGLRAQIKENAIVLVPLMAGRVNGGTITANDSSIRVTTSGQAGGIRAMVIQVTNDTPTRVVFWSNKFATAAEALEELLDITQSQLKNHLGMLMDPPSPAMAEVPEFPSFDGGVNATTVADNAAAGHRKTTYHDDDVADTKGPSSDSAEHRLLWDSNMTTNTSFQGFDYGSFRAGSDSRAGSDEEVYGYSETLGDEGTDDDEEVYVDDFPPRMWA